MEKISSDVTVKRTRKIRLDAGPSTRAVLDSLSPYNLDLVREWMTALLRDNITPC
jgi:hypothetical protein